uniref:Innexin n=1 Tax=Angiostrongylus cantonensis TaxID=6313 RepID=A0A0K0CUB0_ANGCA
MLSLPSVFDILSKVDTYPAEDFVDRLNFGVTVYLLGFFVLITGSKQHFGNPIQCMAPPESPESWVNYYHDYCYIQDKLRIFDMNVYKSIWVPYVLFLQAVFFLIPKFFWKLVGSHWCHGIDQHRKLHFIMLTIFNVYNLMHLRPFLGSSVASLCYVITKWLEVVNGFGQFYMLSCFVGQGDYLWGFHVIFQLMTMVLKGSDDPNTGAFPRIVLSHCSISSLTGILMLQEHMQCVLMLNFINEKIYTFLWFWIVLVSIASTFSAMKQTIALLYPVYRGHIADNFLPVCFLLLSFFSITLLFLTSNCASFPTCSLFDQFLSFCSIYSFLYHSGLCMCCCTARELLRG